MRREPKVRQAHARAARAPAQQQVLRLDVAVHDALMQMRAGVHRSGEVMCAQEMHKYTQM